MIEPPKPITQLADTARNYATLPRGINDLGSVALVLAIVAGYCALGGIGNPPFVVFSVVFPTAVLALAIVALLRALRLKLALGNTIAALVLSSLSVALRAYVALGTLFGMDVRWLFKWRL